MSNVLARDKLANARIAALEQELILRRRFIREGLSEYIVQVQRVFRKLFVARPTGQVLESGRLDDPIELHLIRLVVLLVVVLIREDGAVLLVGKLFQELAGPRIFETLSALLDLPL